MKRATFIIPLLVITNFIAQSGFAHIILANGMYSRLGTDSCDLQIRDSSGVGLVMYRWEFIGDINGRDMWERRTFAKASHGRYSYQGRREIMRITPESETSFVLYDSESSRGRTPYMRDHDCE